MTARMTDLTPCAANPHPYDVLIDGHSGWARRSAIEEARHMCGLCPIMAACHTEHRGEPWEEAVRGVPMKAQAAARRRRGSRRPRDDYDEARVIRRAHGERISLSVSEAAEVVRRLFIGGHTLADIRRITGLKPERYVKGAAVAGGVVSDEFSPCGCDVPNPRWCAWNGPCCDECGHPGADHAGCSCQNAEAKP